MPIQLRDAQYVRSNSETAPGGATIASFQCRLKLVSVTGNAGNYFGKNSTSPFSLYRSGSDGTNRIFSIIWQTTGWTVSHSLTFYPGNTYHVASTINAGAVRVYLNGQLVFSDNRTSAPLKNDSVSPWQLGVSSGTGGNIVMDDVCFWSGYALSLAEVRDMRNRALTPADIAPASHLLNWTLDGPTNAVVTTAANGVKTTTAAGGRNATQVSGSPIFVDEDLTYVPAVRVREAYVGPSRKTLIFTFESPAGASANITGQGSHPTVQLGGGSPQSLATPGSIYQNNYMIYPLPFAVSESDTLLYSADEGWISSSGGPIGPSTNAQATTTPRPILPPPSTAPKTMRVGFNVEEASYYHVAPIYANRFRNVFHGFDTSNAIGFVATPEGEIASLTSGTARKLLWSPTDSGLGSPDAGYFALGNVDLTLEWDGTADATLVSASSSRSILTPLSSNRTGGLNNRRVYRHQLAANNYHAFVRLDVIGPGSATNIRVIDSTVPPDHASRFHPKFTSKLAGSGAIRFMDSMLTNSSNISLSSHFAPRSRASYGGQISQRMAPIINFTTYNEFPADYFTSAGGRTPFVVTTSSPHGLKTGETITFRTINNVINCTDGTSFSLESDVSHILVLSETTFAACTYTGTVKTVSPNQNRTGFAERIIRNQWPIEDYADLCNELGADVWINVPHLLEDEGVSHLARTLIRNLNPGLKVYCEYSNECWNYGSAFVQTKYCDSMGTYEGIGGRRWYARRTGQVHALFASEFEGEGRGGDLVRVFGGHFGGTANTLLVLDYALALGLRVDALAVAPYFTVTPSQSPAVYVAMDIDQLMDVSAYSVLGFPRSTLEYYRDELRNRFPEARLVCYEGGMQTGLPWQQRYSVGTHVAGAKSRAWARHPGIREQVKRVLQNSQDSGCDLFVYYNFHRLPNDYGNLSRGAMWGVYNAGWSQEPGVGDGTDDQFDNRTNYDKLDAIVSPIGLGLKEWMSEVPPPPPPPPPPADEPRKGHRRFVPRATKSPSSRGRRFGR